LYASHQRLLEPNKLLPLPLHTKPPVKNADQPPSFQALQVPAMRFEQRQIKADQEAPLAPPKKINDSSSDDSSEDALPTGTTGGFKNTAAK